ncbi:MAG: bacteriocin-protection protein, partial [Deltaproteobacteria bacterium]
MTWPESVDEALSFGWIDGVRRRIDSESYSIRFTPRRPGSIWSAINIRKIEALRKAGRMAKAGLDAFAARDEKKSAIYSYENRPQTLEPDAEKRFRASRRAWAWFTSQPP